MKPIARCWMMSQTFELPLPQMLPKGWCRMWRQKKLSFARPGNVCAPNFREHSNMRPSDWPRSVTTKPRGPTNPGGWPHGGHSSAGGQRKRCGGEDRGKAGGRNYSASQFAPGPLPHREPLIVDMRLLGPPIGQVISSVAQVSPGDPLTLIVGDGTLDTHVDGPSALDRLKG